MTCLTDAQIQAAADREASDDLRQHLTSCAACRERVRTRDAAMANLADALDVDVPVPARLRRRIDTALASPSTLGATRLRTDGPPRSRRRAFWSAALATAATLVAVLFVAPLLRDADTVSASEILAASAHQLGTPATGIEVLEYQLVIDGIPKDMMPDHANGTYRVWQAIDHDTPGRFRFASYGSDGRMISSIAQDPGKHRRTMFVRLENQPYRFDVTLPSKTPLSLPELERLHMEATITMMQASGNQLLQIVDTPGGRQYRIEVDHPAAETVSPMWDLRRAHVVVTAADYRVVEFAATGTLLKQPYSVSYKLLRRTTAAALEPEAFEVPAERGEIRFSGDGSAVPARDAMVLALRELARLKNQR
jgi:hypothetical protein